MHHQSTSSRKTDETRTARISRDAAGDPIGAALFITADELADLGVDPETTDAVSVVVEDGEVRLQPTDSA